MADGVIGSVKVRVRPDTTTFAKETKAKLERVEKGLKVQVQAELDYNSLKRSATEAVRKLNADLKSGPKVKFTAEISEIGMKSAVKKAARELNALAKAERVKFTADVEAGKVKVSADLDQASLARVNAGLDAYIKRISPKRVPIMAHFVASSGKLVDKQLDLLARPRKAEIRPELDNNALNKVLTGFAALSGVRLAAGIGKEFRELFSNIDRAVPMIGSLTLAALGLGGAMLSSLGSTFALSRALAQIGPGALALPGIFGGIAIGLGATVAVLKDFNQEIPGVGAQLSAIQDQMSAEFWDRARAPIQNLVDNLLPQFAKGLTETGAALGVFFGNLAGSLNGQFDGAIAGLFADLNASIREMATHTDSIATIFRVLAEAGAGRLPELAQWMGELFDRFAAFLDEAQRTGELDAWIDTAIDRLQSLGDVLVNGSKLFGGLARAADNASPGDALSNLADSLDRAQQVVNGSNFQSQLTGVLMASSEMMDEISTRSGPAFQAYMDTLATTLQTTMPRAGEAIGTLFEGIFSMLGSSEVQTGFTKLVDGIAKGVENFAPAFDVLGPKIGAFLELLGQMADTFGLVFSAAISAVAPQMTALFGVLTPIVAQLGPIVAGIFNDLAPVFAVLGENITKVGGAVGPLLSAFQGLWNVIGPLLVPVLKIVVSILGEALMQTIKGVTMVIEGLTQIISGVVDVFKGLWDVIAGLFTGDFSRVGDGFGKIFSGLGDIVMGALKGVAGAIWAFLNGSIFGIFRTGGVKIAAQFKGIWDKFGPIVSKVFGAIKTTLVAAWNAIKFIFEGAFTIIKAIVQLGWNVIRTYFTTYFNVIKTIVTTAWNVITTIFTTVWTVIKTVVMGGFNAVKEFLATSMNAVYATFSGPWNAVVTFLQNIWLTIRTGVTMAWTAVRDNISTVLNVIRAYIENAWSGIKAVTSATWNAIKSAVTTVVNTIKQVVTTVFNAYKTVITTVWNAIKTATTTVWNGIKSLLTTIWNGIKQTATTVYNAIKTAIQNVWNNIKSATSDVWNAIKSTITTAWNGIKSLISDALARVKESISNAWQTVRSATSDAWNTIKSVLDEAWEKIKTAVTKGITTVITKVRELPGQAKAALAGIGTALLNAGRELIGGLIRGIEEKFGAVKDKLNGLTDKLPDWKGPPKKDATLLYAAGQLIMDGLVKGLESRFEKVKAALNGLTSKIPGDASKALRGEIDKGRTALLKLMGQYEAVADQIKAKIKEIRDAANGFKQQVIESVIALGDPTTIGLNEDGTSPTFDQILSNMKQAVVKAKEYAKVIEQLKALDLNETTMMQILSAGPDSLDVAKSIAEAGKEGVDALNAQQETLAQYAVDAGESAKQIYIENGMAAADGFIQGFEQKQGDMVKAMRKIAAEMVAAMKEALGIKSPSRVFRELGGYTGEGFVLGLEDTKRDAEKAIVGLTTARPRGLDVDGSAVNGSGPSTSKTINYYAAAGTPALSGEESLFAALDRARSSGF